MSLRSFGIGKRLKLPPAKLEARPSGQELALVGASARQVPTFIVTHSQAALQAITGGNKVTQARTLVGALQPVEIA